MDTGPVPWFSWFCSALETVPGLSASCWNKHADCRFFLHDLSFTFSTTADVVSCAGASSTTPARRSVESFLVLIAAAPGSFSILMSSILDETSGKDWNSGVILMGEILSSCNNCDCGA